MSEIGSQSWEAETFIYSTFFGLYYSDFYRVAHKKRPELSHGIMQQRNQNESTE